MTVLVVFGSKAGGSQGVAESVARALSDVGHDVRVEPARPGSRLDGVTAAVVVGALYSTRWHKDARRFVQEHAAALAGMPVWLVATGPLDDSADAGTLPAVAQVRAAAKKVGARGEVTFGGRLAPDATGFQARVMAKTRAGDWRNEERIREWAGQVHRELVGT
jgi:menaquinone-dependent protoporphyrinogen oxidase